MLQILAVIQQNGIEDPHQVIETIISGWITRWVLTTISYTEYILIIAAKMNQNQFNHVLQIFQSNWYSFGRMDNKLRRVKQPTLRPTINQRTTKSIRKLYKLDEHISNDGSHRTIKLNDSIQLWQSTNYVIVYIYPIIFTQIRKVQNNMAVSNIWWIYLQKIRNSVYKLASINNIHL